MFFSALSVWISLSLAIMQYEEEHTPNMYLIITQKLISVLLCSVKMVYLMHAWVDMTCSLRQGYALGMALTLTEAV